MPLWRGFLNRVMAATSICNYLQRVAGYCLAGSTREHVMFFAYPAPTQGVFTGTLRAIWNDYATVAPIEGVRGAT
jgi:putative DNA primase/helicase